MTRIKFLVLALAAFASFPAFSPADSPIPITLIADTSTLDPSGGNFTGFGLPSCDRDFESVAGISPNLYPYNNVFFTAQGPGGLTGVYGVVFPAPGINEIYTIVDSTMQAATGGYFASFSNTTSGGGEAGFIATDTNGNQSVYVYDGYGLHLTATSKTSPVAGTTFGTFQSISFMSQGFASGNAEGEIESSTGIYDFSGDFTPSFTLVANASTIPYGASSPFTSFGPVSFKASMSDSNFPGYAELHRAVQATVGGVSGIYTDEVYGPLVKIVDTNTTVPGGSGDFTSFGNPIATVTDIEFTASYSSSQGVKQGIFAIGPYLLSSDFPTLYQILASGTLAPNSNGAHFLSFSMIGNNEPRGGGFSSFEDENIPFIAALDDGQSGLFCTTGIGTSVKILDTGDSLDDKTVSSIQMSPESAGQVFTVFEVGFTDGSSGIYYFDTNVLPEPAMALCSLPLLLAIRRRSC